MAVLLACNYRGLTSTSGLIQKRYRVALLTFMKLVYKNVRTVTRYSNARIDAPCGGGQVTLKDRMCMVFTALIEK